MFEILKNFWRISYYCKFKILFPYCLLLIICINFRLLSYANSMHDSKLQGFSIPVKIVLLFQIMSLFYKIFLV